MRAVPLRLLVAAVAIALVLPALALAAPPNPEARAFLVVNASTGEVLAARNPNARVPIASITKLMTVLVALEHARLGDVVRVDRDRRQGRGVDDQPARRRAASPCTTSSRPR